MQHSISLHQGWIFGDRTVDDVAKIKRISYEYSGLAAPNVCNFDCKMLSANASKAWQRRKEHEVT